MRVIERLRIVEVAEAESVTEAARRYGCSRTTVYKLIARYREGGLKALMKSPAGSAGADPGAGGGAECLCAPSSRLQGPAAAGRAPRDRAVSPEHLTHSLGGGLVRFERPQPNALRQMDFKQDVGDTLFSVWPLAAPGSPPTNLGWRRWA